MKTIEDIKIENSPSSEKREVETVSHGIRIVYYFMDTIFSTLIFLLLAGGINEFISAPFIGELFDHLIFVQLSSLGVTILYYLFFETFLGSTPAKVLLGYTVINQYAKKPSFLRIFARTLIRLMPFEAISCLGKRGWHDKWTNTYVVKRSEKKKLILLLQENPVSSGFNSKKP